jgi:hypothetical protein
MAHCSRLCLRGVSMASTPRNSSGPTPPTSEDDDDGDDKRSMLSLLGIVPLFCSAFVRKIFFCGTTNSSGKWPAVRGLLRPRLDWGDVSPAPILVSELTTHHRAARAAKVPHASKLQFPKSNKQKSPFGGGGERAPGWCRRSQAMRTPRSVDATQHTHTPPSGDARAAAPR